MEYTKAFDLIAGKVEEELKKSGYTKQKTAYEMTDCDWSSDVCSSDLLRQL